MRIFFIGGQGFMTAGVLAVLERAGHEIRVLPPNPYGPLAEVLRATVLPTWMGDLGEIAAEASAADATIHLGLEDPGILTRPDVGAWDTAIIGAIGEALAGAGKTFGYGTGSSMIRHVDQRLVDETTPLATDVPVSWRGEHEKVALAWRNRGVRTFAIRPCLVYGHGKGGAMLNSMLDSARKDGAARYVGAGANRWSTVHVDDLGSLYGLTLDKAPSGEVYFAASNEVVAMKDLAEACSRAAGAGGATRSWPLEEARQSLGLIADILSLSGAATGAKAVRELGWRPTGPTLLDELRNGAYS